MHLLEHLDLGQSALEAEAVVDARGWRMIRAARPILTDRLISWARRTDPGGVMFRFKRTLAAAGLDHEPSASTDELDTLIDEVIAIADQLERHQAQIAAQQAT